ncbi:MAG: response regulator [Haloferacaceae archaeon]
MTGPDAARRILIADDDRQFLEALQTWLTGYRDFEVEAVADGEAAIEAIDSSVELFLCDRRMPELAGEEVIERMRDLGHDVPTIVISAYEPDTYLHEGDVDMYLQKPIDRRELLDAIDEVLSERRPDHE